MGLYKCHVPEAEGENQLSNSPNGTSCCDKQLAFTFHYRPPTKFAKVMFSQMSVCPQWGSRDLSPGGSLSRGVSVPGGGALREAPIRLRAGGTHPTGVHSCSTMPGGSSYWSAFLFNYAWPNSKQ